MGSFLDSSGVPVWVSITKLYIVPKRAVASLVGVLRNGWGLDTSLTYIPLVFSFFRGKPESTAQVSWRCPGVLSKIRSNAQRVLNNIKDRQQRKLEILVCEKLVSVSQTRTTYRERFFVLSRAWDEEKILSPHEESNLRPFHAPMLYHWTTETQRWARSITKLIWHASRIRVLVTHQCWGVPVKERIAFCRDSCEHPSYRDHR